MSIPNWWRWLWVLALGLAVTPAWAQVRVVPTTTYSRGLLTNTTAAASRTYLGVAAASGGSFTNGTFSGGTFTGATNVNIVLSGAGTATTSTDSPLMIWTGPAGATTDLMQWKTNSGTVISRITKEGIVGAGAGFNLIGTKYAGTDMTITRSGNDMYLELIAGGTLFIRPNGTGSGTGLTAFRTTSASLGTSLYVNGSTVPSYTLDINGQARIIGTNGMRFGGTSGATDDTVTVWQPSANVARITASTRTEVTGPMMIGSTGAPAGYVEVQGANNSTSLLVMNSPGTSTVDTLQIKQGGTLKFSITKDSSLAQPGTITTPGTVGAQTINKPIGTVNLAAGATSLVVTDSVCLSATNCIVFGQVLSNDTTCKSVAIVVGTGSFTIYPNAAPTAETAVAFQVLKIQ